jgi:thiol-disulfide isomerase/thioredoxin
MERDRSRHTRAVAVLIALTVGIVGGWALSLTSDGAGDDPSGAASTTSVPGIPTNPDTTGEPFPFVELTTLDGDTVSLSASENRPMVVNFWFSTCEPCKREMPALAAAAAENEGQIDFIGINTTDGPDAARRFLDEFGVAYPNYLDDGDQTAAAKVALMPTTFFLAADGTIVAREAGEVTADELAARIAELTEAGK